MGISYTYRHFFVHFKNKDEENAYRPSWTPPPTGLVEVCERCIILIKYNEQ